MSMIMRGGHGLPVLLPVLILAFLMCLVTAAPPDSRWSSLSKDETTALDGLVRLSQNTQHPPVNMAPLHTQPQVVAAPLGYGDTGSHHADGGPVLDQNPGAPASGSSSKKRKAHAQLSQQDASGRGKVQFTQQRPAIDATDPYIKSL
ncbi:hypothetical protein CXG81DRAFT_19466, partial [Caulochytrium protostelioides]